MLIIEQRRHAHREDLRRADVGHRDYLREAHRPGRDNCNPVIHLTLTGLVATTGKAAVGSTPRKGESLTFRTGAGNLAVTYGSAPAPTGRLISASTCLVVVKLTVPFSVDGAKSAGKFAGATGTGKAVAVVSGDLPKLSSGKCNESNTAHLTAKTAVARFKATVKLTVKK